MGERLEQALMSAARQRANETAASSVAPARLVKPSALPTTVPVANPSHEPMAQERSDRAPDGFDERIAQIAAQVLKLPLDRFDPRERMSRYGVDSIIVTEIMRRISDLLDTPIAPTVFFEARHVQELASILRERYGSAVQRCLSQLSAQASTSLAVPKHDLLEHAQPVFDDVVATNTPASLDPAAWASRFTSSWQAAQSGKPTESLQTQASKASDPTGAIPVAIIGMAGQFAQSENLKAFEHHLRQERDCMSEVPASRWDWRSVYGDPRQGDYTKVKYGGFTPDVDLFDAQFFGISPREANMMDPQHRRFMQCVWHTIESAGYAPSSLAGQAIGLFIGINLQDYAHLIDRAGDIEAMHLTSLGHMFCPNRLSFLLDWHGPSQVIDTACSSSLVALHRAVMSIRHEGCDMAIAGGANLMLSSDMHVMYSKVGMICEDGRCKTFSDAANGYARGDGIGAVLLKRLDLAERDGDPIWAVIRGSAENHGGASSSLTAPNPNAQAALIVQAHEDAGIDPRSVGYIECHGTGTALGDPIEVNGLKLAFEELAKRRGLNPLPQGSCWLGSVKSNIGHAETAAGIAGVIKTVLALQNHYRYRSLHCDTLNPMLELDGSPFGVLQQAQPWPAPVIDGVTELRCAGVSSFGAGGSNAHVVLQEYQPAPGVTSTSSSELCVFSARDSARLDALVDSWIEFLGQATQADRPSLADMAHTLRIGRDALAERLAVQCSSQEALLHALRVWREQRLCLTGVWHKRAALSGSDGEMPDQVRAWLQQDDWPNLASAWVQGVPIDWQSRAPREGVRRAVLPTYPFEPKRHWFKAAKAAKSGVALIHPLVHERIGVDMPGVYRSRLTGQEPFLLDHRVNGLAIMPAAGYLEMIRIAWQHQTQASGQSDALAQAWHIQDAVFSSPLQVQEQSVVEVILRFTRLSDDRMRVQIRGEGDQLHCQAFVVLSPSQGAPVDLPLAVPAGKRWAAEHCYLSFQQMGLDYGVSHQQLSHLSTFERESGLQVLATLIQNSHGPDLTVGRLDAGLQATVGFALSQTSRALDKAAAQLPFAIGSVYFMKPIEQAMYVWVRACEASAAPGRQVFDLDWFDADGHVCVSLRGFESRSIGQEGSALVTCDVMKATPAWQQRPLVPSGRSGPHDRVYRLVAGAGLSSQADWPVDVQTLDLSGDVARDHEALAVSVLIKVQQIAASLSSSQSAVLQLVLCTEPDDPLMGIDAMLRAVTREQSRLLTQLICLPANEVTGTLADRLLGELNAEGIESTVAWVGGLRHVRRWAPQKLLVSQMPDLPWRHGGVYVISGASGALAKCLLTHVTACVNDVSFYLLSRHDPSVQIPQATWLPCDVTDPQGLKRAIDRVKTTHDRLDGVFHLAGVMDDGSFLTKTPDGLRDVLRPKVLGALHLDQATADLPLDFFVAFGSLSGQFGGAGQADYAAANGFVRGLCHRRAQWVLLKRRQGLSLCVDWSFWKDGGMQMPAQVQRIMAQRTGMLPLPSDVGCQVLEHLLVGQDTAVAVLYGDSVKMAEHVKQQGQAHPRLAPPQAATLQPASGSLSRQSSDVDRTEDWLARQVAKLMQYERDEIQFDVDFGDYGFDSISFTEFSNVLTDQLGVPIGPTVFFEHTTIARLAAWLRAEHAQAVGSVVALPGGSVCLSEQSAGDAVPDSSEVEPGDLPVDSVASARRPAFAQTHQTNHTAKETGLATCASQRNNPVCVVGMSGSFPGAPDLETFWDNLVNGRDSISTMPEGRWPAGYWSSLLEASDDSFAHLLGGYIDDVDLFDARYFRVSPNEALSMDPQQRLLLTHAVRALEDAGQPIASLWGSSTGVFLGTAPSGYAELLANSGKSIDSHSSTGNVGSIAPNRISYFLNLHGPSEPIETACSSSLVAVHRAVMAIYNGDCDQALVGGANLLLSPLTQLSFGRAHMLSPDGRCKTFSSQANGYVRGEAVAMLFLKRLDQALADGNPIYGVIAGTAENHGGKANSLTAPNPAAQKAVILRAFERAQVNLRSVGVVEAHGTGTALGDPIEIHALKAAFASLQLEAGQALPAESCAVGSVKTNIGHTELAAGMAGLFKLLLQLRHQKIVPNLHGEPRNPQIDLGSSPFYFPTETVPWPQPADDLGRDLPRVGCVSSFGYGGVNAHVVIEQWVDPLPAHEQSHLVKMGASEHLVLISARTSDQLMTLLGQWHAWLGQSNADQPDPMVRRLTPDLVLLTQTLAQVKALSVEDIDADDDLVDLEVDRVERQAWHQLLTQLGWDLTVHRFMQARTIRDLSIALTADAIDGDPGCLVTHSPSPLPPLEQIAYTSQLGRDEHDHRFAAVVDSIEVLQAAIAAALGGESALQDCWCGDAKSATGAQVPTDLTRAFNQMRWRDIAKAWVAGASFDWRELYGDQAMRKCRLPGYPFESTRFWFDLSVPAQPPVVAGVLPATNGLTVREVGPGTYEISLSGQEPFLRDHLVNGQPVLPGVMYLALIQAVAQQCWGCGSHAQTMEIRDLVWLQPMYVSDPIVVTIQVQATSDGGLGCTVLSTSREAQALLTHAKARVSRIDPVNVPAWPHERAIDLQSAPVKSVSRLYEQFEEAGLSYGVSHRTLSQVHGDRRGVWARVDQTVDAGMALPPGTLDAALQACALLDSHDGGRQDGGQTLYLPFAIDRVQVFAHCPASFQCLIGHSERDSTLRKVDLLFADLVGAVFLKIEGFTARAVRMPKPSTTVQSQSSANKRDGVVDRDALVQRLKVVMAEVLGYAPDDINQHEDLEAYGIDSMSIMSVTETLQHHFGELSKTLFYEFRTLSDVADYFATHHADDLAAFVGPGIQQVRQVNVAGQPADRPVVQPSNSRRSETSDPVALVHSRQEDVAIIGLSGRYPRANHLSAFWNNLRDGVDCIDEVPPDRWRWQDYFSEDRRDDGRHFCKWGGFIDDMDCFDPLFFNMSPGVSIYLDPQERLFLELSWQAIEDAGYTREGLSEVNRQQRQSLDLPGQVGVYAGVMYGEYQLLAQQSTAQGHTSPVGNFYASIANRVSYWLNLHGPSMAIDTMCSSSLTAIHLACQDLRVGSIDMAIAGGVNLNLHPNKYGMLSVGQFISSHGRCESFGADGAGYVPGEGVGCVVLKRLVDAKRDGDQIYGVIKASALNHGGKTNGYSVPNPLAQRALVRRAMHDAQIDPRLVNYVEAHGTGTKLGDPIEISGLTQAFRDHNRAQDTCYVGSVKSNIGHSEAAAGVAALTKVLLQLKHRQIVPSLHSAALNPNIDFERTPFEVNQTLRSWPAPVIDGVAQPRTAGISSYGAGGSNAHLIVQEYDAPGLIDPDPVWGDRPYAFLLSARTAKRLHAYARDWLAFLQSVDTSVRLLDMCFTAQVGREAMAQRFAVLVASKDELIGALTKFVHNEPVGWQGRRPSAQESAPIHPSTDPQQWPKQLAQWVTGIDMSWSPLYQQLGVEPRRVSIPTYPFERDRFRLPVMPEPLAASAKRSRPDLDAMTKDVREVPTSLQSESSVQSCLLATPSWCPISLRTHDKVAVNRLVILLNDPPTALPDETWVLQSTNRDETRWIDYADDLLKRLQSRFKSGGRAPDLLQLVTFPGTNLPVDHLEKAQALWSFLKSFALERPDCRIQWLEYRQPLTTKIVDDLQQLAGSSETHVRRDQGAWQAQRWQSAALQADTSPVWREGGTYLILGGAGGIGTFFAQEILRQTRRCTVVLVGRSSGDHPRVQAVLQALRREAASAQAVDYVTADISDEVAVTALLTHVQRQHECGVWGRLCGVIQSVGVIRDSLTLRKTSEQLRDVMRPKLLGTESLLRATQDLDLDFVTLFGSIAGVTGNIGQTDYAAANAYLDVLAQQAHARGHRSVMTIDWPLWANGGMKLSDAQIKAMHQVTGLLPLSNETAAQAFHQAVRLGHPQTLVLAGDINRIEDTVLRALGRATEVAERSFEGQGDIGVTPLDVSHLRSWLTDQVAQLCQLPAHRIETDVPLSQYGFDSVAFMRLISALEGQLDESLPQTLFFEYPSIEAVVTYLAGQVANKMPRAKVMSEAMSRAAEASAPAAGTPKTRLSSGTEPDDFKRKLIEAVSVLGQLPIHRIETDVPLSQYGFDSVAFMKLTSEIERWIGHPVSGTLFFEFPSIDAVSAHLAAQGLSLTEVSSPPAMAERDVSPSVPLDPVPVESVPVGSLTSDQKSVAFTVPGRDPFVTDTQAIAIVGMAGQFPGANDVDAFWDNLCQGVDSITEVPSDRWSIERWFSTQRELGKTYCKWGGFIDGVDQFDADLFRLSPRDAALIDPQERLLLQTVWRLLEQSGYLGERLTQAFEGNVGVFVGSMYRPYQGLSHDPIHEAVMASSPQSLIANRVSQFFDFQGPSIALDTMCSSAIVALQTAWQSLRDGQCRAAIVGGVNLSLDERKYISLSAGRMVASHVGSTSYGQGDGYLPAEAVGAVLLRPLPDAIAAGDEVLAVIKGVSTVHAGHSSGLYAPSKAAQVRLLKQAYGLAGVSPAAVDYLEAAANGSSQADALEFSALSDVFGATSDQASQRPIPIGAVKSNIGHAEAASGMTQLIKVLLQFRHGKLVPTIKADPVNPAIDFSGSPFELVRQGRPWVSTGDGHEPKLAGIHALGAGGTYAHLILQEGPPNRPIQDDLPRPQLLLLSARTTAQLIEMAQALRLALTQASVRLIDVAYTLQVCRFHLEQRLALLVHDTEDALAKLDRWLADTQLSAPGQIWRNDMAADTRTIKELMSGEAGQAHLAQLFQSRDLAKLALLWCEGVKFAWAPLYQGTQPHPVAVGAYPFAKTRCWFDQTTSKTSVASLNQTVEFTVDAGVQAFVLERLQARLGKVLSAVHLANAWVELGVDSIFMTSLFREIETRFGVSISNTDFLDLPTPGALVDHIKACASSSTREVKEASAGQRALCVLNQWFPDSTGFHVPIALIWNETLDVPRLSETLRGLLEQHVVLKWSFTLQADTGKCLIHEAPEPTIDITVEQEDGNLAQTRQTCWQAFIARPFDLVNGPLFRVLVRHDRLAQQSELLLVIHHAVIDGLSAAMLAQQLVARYRDREAPLPDQASYAHFIDWQKAFVESPLGQAQKDYWLGELKGDVAHVPWAMVDASFVQKDQPLEQTAHALAHLSDEHLTQIRQWAVTQRVTPTAVFLATWWLMLFDRFKQQDIWIGMPTLGRPEARFDHSVGFFANTVVLRQPIDERDSVGQWVARVARKLAQALDHADYPYALVHEAVSRQASRTGQPLFDIMFAMQNFASGLPSTDASSVQWVDDVLQKGSHPLALEILPSEAGWRVRMDYQTSHCSAPFVERLMADYLRLLHDVSSSEAARPLKDVMTQLQGWSFKSVGIRFKDIVAQYAERVALLSGQTSMSYRLLDRSSDGLAAHFQTIGLKRHARVALLMSSRMDQIVASLAVLKAGGVLVPIDVNQPSNRLRTILQDLKPDLILLDKVAAQVDAVAQSSPLLDMRDRNWALQAEAFEPVEIEPHDPAYIIYTSGTSGEAKGVVISQGSLAAHLLAIQTVYRYSPVDCGLQFAPMHVDAALEQWLVPLMSGARVLLRSSAIWSVAEFRQVVDQYGLTVIDLPPSYLHELLLSESGQATWAWHQSLRLMICGGEALSATTARLWAQSDLSSVRLINAYGPTETTITSMIHELKASEWRRDRQQPVPIGRALPGESVHLLDDRGHLASDGPGEIVIAGSGVALGYLGHTQRERAAFVDSIVPGGGRAYRTGDLGQWNRDGELVYLGRLDQQVKVNGHRIECSEVSSALLAHPDVAQAEVLAVVREASSMLVACLVRRGQDRPGPQQLRAFLQRQLPDHMLPARYEWFDGLPVAASGKVDRQALIRLLPDRLPGFAGQSTPRRQASPKEQLLKEIWQEILGVDQVNSTDGFFDLGGDSLGAIRLVALIEQRLGVRWKIATVTQYPTFGQQCQHVGSSAVELQHTPGLLRDGDPRHPVVWLPPVSGDVLVYQSLIEKLSAGRQCLGVSSDGQASSIVELAASLYQQMPDLAAATSVTLVGWSMGGVIAIEVARHLLGKGVRPDCRDVVLIDSYPPAVIQGLQTSVDVRLAADTQYQHHRQLFDAYQPSIYDGRVHALFSRMSLEALELPVDDPLKASQVCWGGVLSGVCQASVLPGHHDIALQQPELVKQLEKILNK